MRFSNAKRVRTASLIAAAFLMLTVAISCQSGDDNSDNTGTGTSSNSSDQTAGQVGLPPGHSGISAVIQTALVDGALAADGKAILRHSEIETDSQGSVSFSLTGPDMFCDTRQNSHLAIWPDDATMIQWSAPASGFPTGGANSSKSYCAKIPASGSNVTTATYGFPPRLTFTLHDPIFGVVIRDGEVTLKMVHGSATATVDTDNNFELSAGQQLLVPVDGPPTVQPLQLSTDDHEIVNGLQSASPLPNLQIAWENSIYQRADETCEISYMVSNTGQSDAGESIVHVAFDGKTIDQTAQPLVAGGSQQLSAPVTGRPCTGTGTLQADSQDTVAESNEDDNQVPIGRANLQITFDNYSQVTDSSCEISYTLINSGEADADASVTHFDLNGVKVDQPAPPLSAGISLPSTVSMLGPCQGNGELQADAQNQVAESNEDDNTTPMTFIS